MEAIAGPGIVVPEAVIHLQRKAERIGLLDGKVEREVVVRPLGGLHPVQHELAAMPRLRVGRGMDAVVVERSGDGAGSHR